MDVRSKLKAIEAKLGMLRETAPQKGEYGFMCPGRPGDPCSSAAQNKVRLWVNPETNSFHCWHCGFGGRSLAPLMIRGSDAHRAYTNEHDSEAKKQPKVRPPCNSLPDGYIPFGLKGSMREAPYLSYLRERGITDLTVGVYRMGYVDTGTLAGRVIIPSFDMFGSINFWSARSIDCTEHLRYRLPYASKDIISNEHMIDWTEPVYLVEGIFDEITIGSQGISLYGKFMGSLLAKRLVEKRPPCVHVCLDSDARTDAMKLVHKLMGYGLTSTLVKIDGKDPGSMSMYEINTAASNAKLVTSPLKLLESRL